VTAWRDGGLREAVITAKLILGAGAVLAAPLFAGALLAGAIGGVAPTPADAGEAGGLTLAPPVARRGGTVTVSNTSPRPLRVAIHARPWVQATDGTLAPNPRRELVGVVRVSDPAFELEPGERRAVRVDPVGHVPGLDAALDVTGEEQDATVHRLIGAVRFEPAQPRRRLTARAVDGVLEIRNLGNTSEPVSGDIVGDGRTLAIAPIRILPGHRVRLRAPEGRVTLRQGGRVVLRAAP
jgi:hypothetical protein